MTANQNNLQQTAKIRTDLANNLDSMATLLEKSSLPGLQYAIADLQKQSQSLREGVFRIFVLGDVKRGKSTVINALIGEDLLPRDVNACTGVITVLRYGAAKKVTIHYQDDTPAEEIDFATFEADYTITVDEAKNLEANDSLAFPNVKYAVVEYPLALLESGIEIIDSPGLNDTEARNELSLGYIHNCQAILFVLRAVQPFTLDERRYLDNYIKDRGLNVFFLINGWDELKNELIDPEDAAERAAAEAKSYQYFQDKLTPYIPENTSYEDRVFTVSALNALRSRIKNNLDEPNTNFDRFSTTLHQFLSQERAAAEFNLVKTLAAQTYNQVHEITSRRIPLLEQTQADLKAKIANTEPEFARLQNLRHLLLQEITAQRDLKAQAIANSFEDYVLRLEDTFEADFFSYEPNLDTLDFLIPGKRDKFYQSFKRAFEAYITDKITTWEKSATQELETAFTEVLKTTEKYTQAYDEIVEAINTQLISRKITYLNQTQNRPESQWKNWTIGCLALATGNLAGVALAGAGFGWKTVLINWLSVFGISRFLGIFTGMMLGPVGVLAVGLGVAGIQAGVARDNFCKYVTQEFCQYLPVIAQEQKSVIKKAVVECFDNYQQELVKRIDHDLQSRKAELDNLVQQQSMSVEERDREINQLQNLDAEVLALYQEIESAIA